MVTVLESPYKSIIVEGKKGEVVISEGDKIRFCLESGELKRGIVTKLFGKGDKVKIQILPHDKECEEIWPVLVMAGGSLEREE